MKRVLVLLFVALVAETYEIYEEDVCCLPRCPGPCKGYMPRWYYNIEKKACQSFIYGGCGGNKNNFKTKCDCQKRCGDNKDICCLPRRPGPCKTYKPRWYYNSEKEECQRFIYGGCEGNKNNFKTKCDCQKRCGNSKDICCLPKRKGPCYANIPRWYYNSEKEECQRFKYGGCKGNKNNFMTKCDCQNRCGNNKDICCQPKKVGPCKAAIPRWYYNSANDTCVKFTYGGCQGNQNNFEKKSQCEKKCL